MMVSISVDDEMRSNPDEVRAWGDINVLDGLANNCIITIGFLVFFFFQAMKGDAKKKGITNCNSHLNQ